MDEESSSWIRRAKYSHTVCHRIITPRSDSLPVTTNRDKTSSGLKRMPLSSPSDLKSLVGPSQAKQQATGFTNRKRATSPSPQIPISDSFKEAKSGVKRFSTPHPIRVEATNKGNFSRKSSFEKLSHALRPLSFSGPLKDRPKSRKEMRSTKSFDHSGNEVTAMGVLEEHRVDTSDLTRGDLFAHGKFSQLYHGVYKGEAVALKITRASDDCEDRFLGARLEKQFTKEATLLSRLSHPNVVKVILFIMNDVFGVCFKLNGLFLDFLL